MSSVIPQRDLRNQNAAIMAAVAAGQSFVITRHGTPAADPRPIGAERRTLVPRARIVEVAAGTPRIDAEVFRADLERLADQHL
ncbi:prevent-host-death family protein [mine drainage metagenome]|uniref:Prevent-host-death family protein n=1 Tax=mine drainage metagenome TaxID=410659 RepID=T1A088_9ZZZZ